MTAATKARIGNPAGGLGRKFVRRVEARNLALV
jgi:hypothetical protein